MIGSELLKLNFFFFVKIFKGFIAALGGVVVMSSWD